MSAPRRGAVPGRCPSCERPGVVGAPCPERVCLRHGYHAIPRPDADAYVALPRGQQDPAVGTRIGDYLIVGLLGAGGFGKVLLAVQEPLCRLRAALKLMQVSTPNAAMAARLLAKFQGEAEALAVLNHPNIVRLLKYGMHEGAPYLVMEYVDGARTLHTEVRDVALRGDELDPSRVHAILGQLLDGLEAAHALGVVHRDIKPDNIMLQAVVGNADLVRILDFGLAKFTEEGRETSMIAGTPAYMAPEQYSRRDIGPWTDLYAVGVIAFELFTGRRPFPGGSYAEVMAQKLDPRYDPLAHAAGLDLPEAASRFLRRALAPQPGERYQSAEAFRRALAVVFESVAETGFMQSSARDYDGLLDSTDLDGLRRERERLARESERVEAERRAVEEERRRFEAERDRWREQAKRPAPAPTAIETVAGDGGGEDGAKGGESAPPVVWTRRRLLAAGAGGVAALGLGSWALWPSEGGARVEAEADAKRMADPRVEAEADAKRMADPLWTRVDTPTDGEVDLWKPCPPESPELRVMAVEVTNAMYQAFDPDFEPRTWQGVSADELPSHPAVEVSWEDASRFCAWLSKQPGMEGARLPTEEEWERFCRAGTTTRYWSGDDESDLARVGWYDKNSDGRTHRVGEKPANPWGLYDVHGNVWEWTSSFYDNSAGVGGRVFRGGSWFCSAWRCASSDRGGWHPAYRNWVLGFRVVRPQVGPWP